MEFKTSISKMTEEDHIIRGVKLSELIAKHSFTDSVFLLLGKRLPDEKESKVFSTMLTSVIDHGMGTASSMTARFVSSTGNELNTSVGAGILALGKYHGSAIEPAMKQLQEVEDVEAFVSKCLKEKKRIFGYGHKIHKDGDPRVEQILSICKDIGYTSKYSEKALEIDREIEKQKGKRICLNIDGLMAALLLEMGFSPSVGNGVFIAARTASLVAQAVEEKENEKPVRRVDEEEIQYKE